MGRSQSELTREYRRISALLGAERPDLGDEEKLALARRLTELAPLQADSWWSVATQISWMIGDLTGSDLSGHTLYPELVRAWDRSIELDSTDAAAPYNQGCVLERAGMLVEAYVAYVLAGRTELDHPSDLEWPAHWHFEHAVFVALELDRDDLALEAARVAVDAGAPERDAMSLVERVRGETDRRRPT